MYTLSLFCFSVTVVPKMADNAFDPRVFEKQYLRAEKVPGLDFTQDWDRDTLLSQIKEMNKGYPPLLQRKYKPLPKRQEPASASTNTSASNASAKNCIKFRVMQWNMLAQGPFCYKALSPTFLDVH